MADAEFRYGLRVLWSGGADMLGPSELQNTIKICTQSLDNQLLAFLDVNTFEESMGKKCYGSFGRLVKAVKKITNHESFSLKDVIEVGPRKLLMVDGFGDGSILAAKSAFDDQLKTRDLPLPISWQIPPSYFLIRGWES